MYARQDDQGTAIGESALCPTCVQVPRHREFVDSSDSIGEHVDCSGNDDLACVACGEEESLEEVLRALDPVTWG